MASLDFRLAMIAGPAEDFSYFVGTMVQESFATCDVLRAASDASSNAYSERLAEDFQAVIDRSGLAGRRFRTCRYTKRINPWPNTPSSPTR